MDLADDIYSDFTSYGVDAQLGHKWFFLAAE